MLKGWIGIFDVPIALSVLAMLKRDGRREVGIP